MNDEKINNLASQIYYALIASGNDLSYDDLEKIILIITEYFYAAGTYEDESEDNQ